MTSADNLNAACLELAQTMKWTQTPIDANEITELADSLSQRARSMVSEPLGIDLPLLERAVRYMRQAHGMPMGSNTEWFDYTLQALLEVARPNTGIRRQSISSGHVGRHTGFTRDGVVCPSKEIALRKGLIF